jgi:hypothetical protein
MPIEKKVWNELDEEALSALRKIIQYKEKSIIYRELFKGNYNDTYIWNIVKKLQRKHLVIVHREGKNVIKFEFLPVLEELVPLHPKETIIPERAKEKVIQELDTFSFSLKTNLNKSTSQQPDYTETFILDSDIKLKVGIKYICGGWKNTDGSITFRLRPFDYPAQKMKEEGINDVPPHIKEVMRKNMNDFNFDEME